MTRLRLPLLLSLLVAACGPSGGTGDPPIDSGTAEDADGDSINDDDEGAAAGIDTDGDGNPDAVDTDSDGDGIPDYREAGDANPDTAPRDSDGDGTPDFRDTDSDDNGRADGDDGFDDPDGDGLPNFADRDDDGDDLLDTFELGDDPDAPVDSDGDGTPDFQDEDSDGDTIADVHDRLSDPDGDGIPAYQDLDSDGDCRPDAIEAGDASLDTPPVDTDGDTGGDFVDLDSDNDGLLDSLEDLNCNGASDPGESSAADDDTDGDGVSDLVEVAAGTDPSSPTDNPQANGDFVFVVPYVMPPSPEDDTLDFATDIVQADVYFSMDTTGSMGGAIANLKSSLSTIAASLRSEIPNVAIGAGGYDDFPSNNYGSGVDQPFYLRHRVMTVNSSEGLTSVQQAVNGLVTHNGADTPESGYEALYQAATGAGVSVLGANVPAFNPATAPPTAIPAGEQVGTIGGVGFRAGSFPIIVQVTDAVSHNGDGGNYSPITGTATRAAALSALNGIGARVIGVVTLGGAPETDLLNAVNGTDARVPPSAWDGARPTGCAAGQCCTGTNGAGRAPVGGLCPLSFLVSSTGAGLGTSITTAIGALVNFAEIDVGASIADDPGDLVNAVNEFVDHIEANPAAPTPCTPGLTAIDGADPDTFLDTYTNVRPGSTACFDVIPKMNTTVMPLTTPQMFTATITVFAEDGLTVLDTRRVFFLVPPEIPDVPVD